MLAEPVESCRRTSSENCTPGSRAAPLVHETLHRRGEPELIEADRPQPPDHAAHSRVHVVHALDDRAARPRLASAASRARVANRHRVELDRVEILPELVVQLAREMLALVLLRTDAPLHELAVHRERSREASLGLLARRELEARLPDGAGSRTT